MSHFSFVLIEINVLGFLLERTGFVRSKSANYYQIQFFIDHIKTFPQFKLCFILMVYTSYIKSALDTNNTLLFFEL